MYDDVTLCMMMLHYVYTRACAPCMDNRRFCKVLSLPALRSTARMVMQSPCTGDALDPSCWKPPNKALSLSLSLSLSLTLSREAFTSSFSASYAFLLNMKGDTGSSGGTQPCLAQSQLSPCPCFVLVLSVACGGVDATDQLHLFVGRRHTLLSGTRE